MSKYFSFKNNTFTVKKGVRPGNQSTPETVKKIGKKYDDMNDNPNIKQTSVGEKFKNIFFSVKSSGERVPLKNNQTDIVHGVSIANIMKVIAAAMTQKKDFNEVKDCVEKFGFAIFSEEEKRKEFVDFFKEIKKLKADKIMDKADLLVDMINCSPKNLMAGNSSTNRSIGQSHDPHVVDVIIEADKPAIPTTLPEYTQIKNAFRKLALCFGLDIPEEDDICKSSTVNTNPKKSFFDKNLFPQKIKGITRRQSDNLEQVKKNQKRNGVDPHEDPRFENVCTDFETTNQTGLTPFIAQDFELHDEITRQNLDTASYQARMELYDDYGLSANDLPSSYKQGIFGSDYDESEDEERSDKSANKCKVS